MTTLLTPEERTRFAEYLDSEVASNRQLLEQLESLPMGLRLMENELKKEIEAAERVAKNLRSRQSMEV